MTLSSWTLDNTLLDLDFGGHENEQESFAFSTFSESNEWTLVGTSVWRNNAQCSHVEVREFTQMIYSMTSGQSMTEAHGTVLAKPIR